MWAGDPGPPEQRSARHARQHGTTAWTDESWSRGWSGELLTAEPKPRSTKGAHRSMCPLCYFRKRAPARGAYITWLCRGGPRAHPIHIITRKRAPARGCPYIRSSIFRFAVVAGHPIQDSPCPAPIVSDYL